MGESNPNVKLTNTSVPGEIIQTTWLSGSVRLNCTVTEETENISIMHIIRLCPYFLENVCEDDCVNLGRVLKYSWWVMQGWMTKHMHSCRNNVFWPVWAWSVVTNIGITSIDIRGMAHHKIWSNLEVVGHPGTFRLLFLNTTYSDKLFCWRTVFIILYSRQIFDFRCSVRLFFCLPQRKERQVWNEIL